MQESSISIPLNKITPNPFQPRKDFDDKSQREITESIRRNGLIQPIVVRQHNDGYQILAGERRFRAIESLGLPTIHAIIRELNDEEMQTLSIIENLQREDLNPIELAESMQSLVRDLGYSQDKLASQLGKDRSTVTNLLRLLELPEELKKDVTSKKITSGHARALLGLKDSPKIFMLRDQIIAKQWSVRETERKVKEALKNKNELNPISRKPTKDANIKALEEQLSEHLGTPVEIWGETEGSIQISFKDVLDFNRIFNLILEKERDEDFE